MILHTVIYELYPEVTEIRGDLAYDASGKIVSYDKEQVKQVIQSREYVSKRRKEYPSIQEQLDTLYHGGLTEWKATIKAVKDKYPKP